LRARQTLIVRSVCASKRKIYLYRAPHSKGVVAYCAYVND
jgi:hypothetical protein